MLLLPISLEMLCCSKTGVRGNIFVRFMREDLTHFGAKLRCGVEPKHRVKRGGWRREAYPINRKMPRRDGFMPVYTCIE